MHHAYVGIASDHGLQCLWPEGEHTSVFLHRQAARQWRENAVCFWAVLDDSLARYVTFEVDSGNRRAALLLLQCVAKDLGTYIPCDPLPDCTGELLPVISSAVFD